MPPAYLECDTTYSLLAVATKQGAAAHPSLGAMPMRAAVFPLASLVAATTMDEGQARAVQVSNHPSGCLVPEQLLSMWQTVALRRGCPAPGDVEGTRSSPTT